MSYPLHEEVYVWWKVYKNGLLMVTSCGLFTTLVGWLVMMWELVLLVVVESQYQLPSEEIIDGG